ncbi:formin-like 2 domain protein, partial [Trifolium medium]|nr:formin-like 2 domain protein [Trifolium medium]
SEFLYLGTIVNSRGDDLPNGDSGGGGGGRSPRKMDSPELQPLPPLARQGSRRLYDEGVNAGEDEEEE